MNDELLSENDFEDKSYLENKNEQKVMILIMKIMIQIFQKMKL